MRESLNLVFAQAVWAIAQAALLLYLAHVSGLELVGVVTAGFAVFAPIALLLSLNLRTSVAINLLPNVPFGFLLVVRGVTSLAAVFAAAFVAWSVDSTGNNAICAALLLSTKYIDTLADLKVGFYQRDNQMGRIGLSLLVRGLSLLLAMIVSLVGDLSPLVFCALAATHYAVAFVLLDLRRMGIHAADRSLAKVEGLLKECIGAVRKNWMSALFPAADNLHQNCLRLGATLFFEIKTVGLIGLALTAYAPMQLVVTAVGMKVLPHLRQRQQAGDETGFKKMRGLGMLIGLGIAAATTLVAFVMPTSLYQMVFSADGEVAKRVTIMIGIAHLLLPMAGFMSLSLVSSDNRSRYLISPALAVIAFWLAAGILYMLDSVTLLQICAAVLVASTLRVWVSWGGHFDSAKAVR